MILTIAHKEFRSLLCSPSTWIILGVLQFIIAWIFLVRLDLFLQYQTQLSQVANAPGATQFAVSSVAGMLSVIEATSYIMLVLIPIFSMRLFAEERRSHTLVLLLASPIANWEIVLGKFTALVLLLSIIIAACMIMLMTLALGTKLDMGLLATNALGLFLLATCYTSLGLYFSTLTSQPLLAAFGTMATLFGFWLIDYFGSSINIALRNFSPTVHFQSFNEGMLTGKDIAYYLLFVAICLLLAVRRLNNTRTYGQ